MGSVTVLDQSGDDTRIEWDPKDDESVSKARKQWNEMKDQGYEFFEAVETKGKKVTKFNRKLGKVIATPGTSGEAKMGGGPNAAVLMIH